MLLQGLVGKNTGRTHLDQIPAELAFESAVLVTPKVDLVAQYQRIEIASARIVAEKRVQRSTGCSGSSRVNERTEVLVVNVRFRRYNGDKYAPS